MSKDWRSWFEPKILDRGYNYFLKENVKNGNFLYIYKGFISKTVKKVVAGVFRKQKKEGIQTFI